MCGRQDDRIPGSGSSHSPDPSALTVADLCDSQWPVELFFDWIKQRLHINSFQGTSPKAVRAQTWIAVTAYFLVAILRRRLESDRELHTLLAN